MNGPTDPGGSPAPLVARQAGGTGAALIAGTGARYVAALVAARALGAAGFGIYMLATTIGSILSIIGTAGLSPGVLPFLARARDEGSDRGVRAVAHATLSIALTASLALSVLLFAAAGPISTIVFGDPALAPALRMFSGVVVLGSLVGASRSLLHGLDAVWQQQWFERVLAVVVTGLALGATWALGLGMAGAAAATYLGLGAALAGSILLLRKRVPKGDSGEVPSSLYARLLRQSWPLMGTTMLVSVLLWSDVLLMGVFGESGNVGIYGAAARLASAGVIAHEALGPILLVLAAEYHVKADRSAIARVYHLTVRWALGPSLVILAVLFVWAPRWLSLFGPEFAAGVTPLRVLLAGKAIAVLCGMPGRIYAVIGLERRHLVNMVVLCGGNIALNCWWIPRHGMLGAAAATAVSLGVVRVFQALELRRLYRLWPWRPESFGAVAGLLALAGGAWMLRGWGDEALYGWAWLGMCAAFVAACAVLITTVALGEEDRALWARVRRNRGA